MLRFALFVWAAAICAALDVQAGGDAPVFFDPVAVAFPGKPVVAKGAHFGARGPGCRILVTSGKKEVCIPSSDPSVRTWEDGRITVNLPETVRPGCLTVVTPGGVSLPLEVYTYDWFDIPPTAGTNAHPLAIAVDTRGRVWVNQEFHLEFQMLDPSAGRVRGLPIPRPAEPPFATKIFGDHRTPMSEMGEDILVDPRGRIWLTEGGAGLYNGAHSNHSRIVCFDPTAAEKERYRVYDIPGDKNEVFGLIWDAPRCRLWFTQGGMIAGAAIGSLDPERPPGAADYRFYRLPHPKSQPADLALDRQGSLWYTAYWGNAIGRLNPESGAIEEFPLPRPIGQARPAAIVGSGPWQILIAPNGDVVFNEFFDNTLCRFRVSGQPRLLERVVPDADQATEQVHSIAFDAGGRLWFTQFGADKPGTRVSLGFVTADWRSIVLLPPLSAFPARHGAGSAGIAIDSATGAIWFCEFWRQRIGRLRRVVE